MTFNVTKLKSNRMYQHVVEQIEASILKGDIKPGESLPPELKLKEMFDTSRGTIREALRVLEEKGLVDVRVGVGGGAFVRAPDAGKISESLDLLLKLGQVGYDHLAEFREAVEGIVASLAAQRAGKDASRRLAELIDRAKKALEQGDQDAFLKVDIEVHVAIAEIADNPLFTAVLRMVHENILDAHDDFSLSGEETLEENHRDLCRLVETILQGKSGEAAELARLHVRKYNTTMKAQHQRLNGRNGNEG